MQELPCPSRSHSLQLPGRPPLAIAVPENPEALLDALTDEEYEKDQLLPYWAEQWPSSRALLSFLSDRPIPKEWLLCELGCGLGMISAAEASLTDAFTVATDIAPQGCRFTRYNIMTNGGTPRVVCGDWRHLPFRQRFDAVIASDVLYEQRWIEPVIAAIDRLLKPDGRAWIADPCRRFWPLFKESLGRRGFSPTVYAYPAVEGEAGSFEVLEITRR